jgi:hypothetical protein
MTLEIICNQIIGLGIWCLTSLSTILSYIVGVSFIGGGNWNIRRKSLTCHKSLTNFTTTKSTHYKGQAKKDKGQTMIYKKLTQKLQNGATRTPETNGI